MRTFMALILALLAGCSSGERESKGPEYGRYNLKIQLFHSPSIFSGEVFECEDIIYNNKVELKFIDRSDLGGRKYFEGVISVTSNSVVQCADSSQILFIAEETRPRFVAVEALVKTSVSPNSDNYQIWVQPDFYDANTYAPVYERGEE